MNDRRPFEPSRALLRFSGSVERDPRVEAWFERQSPVLRAIAQTWFARMRRSGDDVRELLHDGCPVVCVDDAPFGCVNAFRAHVNVGFFHGAALPDPSGLLQGSGRFMRHVKMRPHHAVDVAAMDALVADAYRDIGERLVASN